MINAHRRIALLTGVAASTLGLAAPALAATVDGVRQEDSATIAINLYELGTDDPAASFGTTDTASIPGGAAAASAQILCAEASTCPEAGAIEHWAITDPTEMEGNREAIVSAYRGLRDTLQKRVRERLEPVVAGGSQTGRVPV